MNLQEKNRLSNIYRREANELGIGSPYRINEYINYRLRGYSQATAIKKVKEK